jgi:hypothetical protein
VTEEGWVSMTFLFNSDAAHGAVFREIFARELPDLEFFHCSESMDPEKVRYLLTWTAPDDISRYRNLEVLFSIGQASISSIGKTYLTRCCWCEWWRTASYA